MALPEDQKNARAAKLYIVRDKDDNLWGPFDTPKEAVLWGFKKWPAELGEKTWDVEGIRPPD